MSNRTAQARTVPNRLGAIATGLTALTVLLGPVHAHAQQVDPGTTPAMPAVEGVVTAALITPVPDIPLVIYSPERTFFF